jgi:hypothetical protein
MTELNVTARRFADFMALVASDDLGSTQPRWLDPDNFRGHLPGQPDLTYHEFMASTTTTRIAFDGFLTDFRKRLESADMHVFVAIGTMTLVHTGAYVDWQGVCLMPTGDKVELVTTITIRLNESYQVVECYVLFDRVELLERLHEARPVGA